MQLGAYEVLESLGKGSFGEVFLARDLSASGDGRTVAVKRLRDTVVDDPIQVERLALEAKICSTLRHPNIVRVHGLVESPDGYLLVMEHLEGVELRRIIQLLRRRNRLLHPGISLELAVQLCRGLHFAHVAADPDGNPLGLVHRDVKPGNLMIARDGQLKVMDFGVARVDFARTRTSVLSVKGTLQYMAPEQASGVAIDARVDQFATGLVLAELLLGHPVYRSPNDASLYFQVGTAAVGPALEEAASHYPRVAPILERALALVPEDRFSNQLEMAEALLEVLPDYQPAPSLAELVDAVLNYETDLTRWSVATPSDLRQGNGNDAEMDRLRAIATRMEGTPGQEDSAGPGRERAGDTPRPPGRRPAAADSSSLGATPAPGFSTGASPPTAEVDPDAVTAPMIRRAHHDGYGDEITVPGVPQSVISVVLDGAAGLHEPAPARTHATGTAGGRGAVEEADTVFDIPLPSRDSLPTEHQGGETGPRAPAPTGTAREGDRAFGSDHPGESAGSANHDLEDVATVVVRVGAPSDEARETGASEQARAAGEPPPGAARPEAGERRGAHPSPVAGGEPAGSEADTGKGKVGSPIENEDAWFDSFADDVGPSFDPRPAGSEVHVMAAAAEAPESLSDSRVARFLFGLLVVLVIGVPVVLLKPWVEFGTSASGGEGGGHGEVPATSALAGGSGGNVPNAPQGQQVERGGEVRSAVALEGAAGVASMPATERVAPSPGGTSGGPSGAEAGGDAPVRPTQRKAISASWGGATAPVARGAIPRDGAATGAASGPAGGAKSPVTHHSGRARPRGRPTAAPVKDSGLASGTLESGASSKQEGSGTGESRGGRETNDGDAERASGDAADVEPGVSPGEEAVRDDTIVAAVPGDRRDSEGTAGTPEAPGEPDVADAGTLVLRVIPGDSLVRIEGVDVRDSCWDGCRVVPGKHVVEVIHPDGRSRTFSLTLASGGTRRCLYRFDLSEPLQCR